MGPLLDRLPLWLAAGLCATLGAPAYAVPTLDITPVWTNWASGTEGTELEGGAEIVAIDAASNRAFVTNSENETVDVLVLTGPDEGSYVGSFDVSSFGAPNSVAVSNGKVAIAVENGGSKQDLGQVWFFDANETDFAAPSVSTVEVGALPDMLTFTPDGGTVLVANEGEPDFYGAGSTDPEGSVSIIEVASMTVSAQIGFGAVALDPLVRISSPGATQAQDIEPEYISVSPDGSTAFVTLQENNAVAVIDIASNTLTRVDALGYKDHSLDGNGLDASNRDDIDGNIQTYEGLFGLYMPDAIDCYKPRGKGKGKGKKTYCITANEGDDRGDADEDARGDAIRFKDIEDVISFGRSGIEVSDALAAMDLGADEALGRLNISSIDGFDGDGKLDQLYSYGARSFTIWDEDGEIVWDSGDALEQITAAAFPAYFNASNDANEDDGKPAIDDRSDNKGPEPEAVTITKIRGEHYAFIGLERIGGFVVYNVSDPENPEFVLYENNRDFSADNVMVEAGMAGDLGPESILVIDKKDSPLKGTALVVVANEVSGSTTIYALNAKTGKGKRKDK